MKTVYYNFYSFEGEKVSGGEDRRAVLVRECAPRHSAPAGNNVISLEEYRTRQTAQAAEQPEGSTRERQDIPKRPDSGVKEKLMLALELVSCAALIAVAAVACAVFLL